MKNPRRLLLLVALPLTLALTACGGGGGGGGGGNPPPDDGGTVQADTTPDSFSFSGVSDADRSTIYESNSITVTGINAAAAISISGGEYAINGNSFRSDTGEVVAGDQVIVRVTSTDTYESTARATLSIGGVSADFTVTTGSAPVALARVKVDVDLNMRHTVGGVDQFDRRKVINLHASNTEADWFGGNSQSLNAANEDPDLMSNFLDGYDVYLGRDTGAMKWQLSLLDEHPSKPGYADDGQSYADPNTAAASNAIKNGGGMRWVYATATDSNTTLSRTHQHRATDMVVGGQQHPYWPDGKDVGQGWSFSQTDTMEEPLGTAVGHFMATYLYEYFNRGPDDEFGQPKPVFLEVMNEPLYELVDYAATPTTPQAIFEFHNTVAAEVKNYVDVWGTNAHENVLVGGYTVAFPDYEKSGFANWEQRDKLFLDIAGENMDFVSIHLYDFPDFNGTRQLRRGSNVEATFDMLEQYSAMRFGQPKPFLVSEVGATVHSMMNDPWSAERDSYKLRALNGLTMSFLERPDQILKVIPFITIKAEWGREDGTPYTNRLMRQKKEANGESGEKWVYTELVKYFQLWSGVDGTRVDSWSEDLDVQVNAYVKQTGAAIVLNSLEFTDTEIDLSLLGDAGNNVSDVILKELYFDDSGKPVLTERSLNEVPATLTLKAEATSVLQITYTDALDPAATNSETKYYADTYKQAIEADTPINFAINDVIAGSTGEATLRLGLGRQHGKSLTPTVSINGERVSVPADYRGYDQFDGGRGRNEFYGVIEVPVPLSLLQADNHIELTFPDTGGFVATATLQVFNTDQPLNRGAR